MAEMWYTTRVESHNFAAAMLLASCGMRQPIGRLSVPNHTTSSDAEQSKICSTCNEFRPLSEFPWSSAKRNGKVRRHRRGVCRLCLNDRNAKRRRRATSRDHVVVAEKFCQGCRQILPASLFGVARREGDGLQGHCKACRREYREANKEREVQRVVEWQRANMDKVKANQSRWYLKDPDKAKLIARTNAEKRRVRKTGAGGSYSLEEWSDLCARYDYRCLACGSTAPLTADHVVPVSRGGTSNIDNIQPLCQSCNSKKSRQVIDYRPLEIKHCG